MYYNRIIKNKFNEVFREFPVIGIVGPRQSGKTTFIKSLIPEISRNCIYYDMELPSDFELLNNAEFIFKQQEEACIIIDEIQRKPDLFPLLRALADQNPEKGRFIILGSAAPSLLRKSAESLAGRIYYLEMQPFNLEELPENTRFKDHLFKGGFPPALFSKNDVSLNNWLLAFLRAYIESDLPMLGLNADPVVIRRFWTMLAYHHSNIWNASDFSRALGLTHPTINKYLDFLEGAFLIRKLRPFYTNIGKRLVKAPKIYIRDTGLLHKLLNFNSLSEVINHTQSGATFEGYVIENVDQLKSDYLDIFYYRTHAGAECDLIITKSQKVVACCEIKFSDSPTISKGFYNSIDDLESLSNFIITPYSIDIEVAKTIRKCSIDIFLKKYLPNLS